MYCSRGLPLIGQSPAEHESPRQIALLNKAIYRCDSQVKDVQLCCISWLSKQGQLLHQKFGLDSPLWR
jgi:hypothetical protein